MPTIRSMLWTTLALFAVAGTAAAQGGPGPGAGPGASAPGMGMGRGPMARWGSDFTPGWTMMSAQERSEHQQRMRSMKSYDECKAYRDRHHEQMTARAKEKGGKAMAQPRRDACAGLKP